MSQAVIVVVAAVSLVALIYLALRMRKFLDDSSPRIVFLWVTKYVFLVVIFGVSFNMLCAKGWDMIAIGVSGGSMLGLWSLIFYLLLEANAGGEADRG